MIFALRDSHGRKYPVRTKIQIGSDPSNQVVLLDPQVIPFHAALWEQQGALMLQDFSAGSATYVNQIPVQGTATLRIGDQLTIGRTFFTVDDLNMQSAAPAEAPKKRGGCFKWLLIGAGILAAECLILAAGGFYVYNTDVQLEGDIQNARQLISGTSVPALGVSQTGVDQPGPDLLSLSDLNLISNFTTSFSQRYEMTGESLSPEGAAVTTSLLDEIMQQTTPEWISYQSLKEIENGNVLNQIDAGIVKGMIYSGPGTCTIGIDPNVGKHVPDHTPSNILLKEPSGYVKLIESGITINGVITDRYELTGDNFTKSGTINEFDTGSLYRARDGGYLVHMEYRAKVNPQSSFINVGDQYSTTEPSTLTVRFDRTYSPDGTLSVKVPEICAEPIKNNVQTTSTPSP